MNPRKPPPSFTSLRIIGEKAQRLLSRARQHGKQPADKPSSGFPPAEERDSILVHLSIQSVVKAAFAILAILLGVELVYLLQDKIILFLLSAFIAVIVDPGVQALTRWGIPRGIAVLLHYFIALFLFVFLLVSLIPIIAKELQNIALFISVEVNAFIQEPEFSLPLVNDAMNEQLSELVRLTLENLSINQFTDALQSLGQSLSTATQASLKFAAQLAGSVVNFFTNMILVLVMAFFFQMEKERIISWIRGFLPRRYRSYVDTKSEAIHMKLAQWARGQLVLCFSIGLLVFIALFILQMPYALTLGILAGFTEFIPVIGPFIAAIPAVLIALTQKGLIWALVLTGVYYVIQWCENNLLVPLIMKRAVGLSPLAIIFAMLIGISFPQIIHPVLGIILSIPVTTIIALFLQDWQEMRSREKG
ncbi:MAG: AI-2E family transporter [Candidatus Peregrinibacteria bacterium]|nr:AI-2E family transporter [Candidatus Peregrinibacteria bacterium]